MDDVTPNTPAPAPAAPEEKKDMLDFFLDLSFRTAITPKVIRWLYIMGLVLSAVLTARWVWHSFGSALMGGIVSLLFAPIIFILYALVTRVVLEVILAIFSIAESLKNIEKRPRL